MTSVTPDGRRRCALSPPARVSDVVVQRIEGEEAPPHELQRRAPYSIARYARQSRAARRACGPGEMRTKLGRFDRTNMGSVMVALNQWLRVSGIQNDASDLNIARRMLI